MPAASTEGRALASRWWERARREPWLVAFVVLALASVLPLCVTRYLPFCDLNGAEGLLGAWSKAGDPRARIDAFFDIQVRPLPNALFYAVGRALVTVVSAPVAANIYLAFFCVLAVPLSLAYALRSFGKPVWLALLSFAFVYHRCVWYGFVGSATAVPLLVLSWGLANRAFVAVRWTREHTWLALVFFLLATAHGFLVLVGASLLGVWMMLAAGGWRRMARNAAVLVPGFVYLAPWLGSAGERSGSGASFVGQLVARTAPRAALGRTVAWFIDGYAGSGDEVLAGLFALTLLGVLAFGVRADARRSRQQERDGAFASSGDASVASPADSSAASSAAASSVASSADSTAIASSGANSSDAISGVVTSPLWRLRLPLTALCLGAGYLLLPMSILKPVDWWAVHVRLLVPFVLAVVLLVPVRPRGLPLGALGPLVLASFAYFGYMAVDFRTWYRGVETRGFDEVVAALPEAPQVLMLWPDFTAERHYAHFPMSHFGTLLLGEKGGRVSPVLGGLPRDMWIVAKPEPPGPGWGLARAFRWEQHAASWDFFLVKRPAPGNGTYPIAWPANYPVEQVAASGLWSLWRKR